MKGLSLLVTDNAGDLADINVTWTNLLPTASTRLDTIHNVPVKGLWLLFTDNASDGKVMEYDLTEKFGSRKPGGMKEKI